MANNSNPKIFLVDDDVFCLTLYDQFLKKLGYDDVISFTSGDDCLEKLDEHPSLVFLDYNMEGMNGIDVLKKIKEFDSSIIVYFISGQENVEIAANAIKDGATDYIVKSSISPERMKAVMENAEQKMVVSSRPVKKSFFGRMKAGLGI